MLPVRSYQKPVSLLVFDFEKIDKPQVIQKGEKMTPVRLLKRFSDLYGYSFWKVCHPVRL